MKKGKNFLCGGRIFFYKRKEPDKVCLHREKENADVREKCELTLHSIDVRL